MPRRRGKWAWHRIIRPYRRAQLELHFSKTLAIETFICHTAVCVRIYFEDFDIEVVAPLCQQTQLLNDAYEIIAQQPRLY